LCPPQLAAPTITPFPPPTLWPIIPTRPLEAIPPPDKPIAAVHRLFSIFRQHPIFVLDEKQVRFDMYGLNISLDRAQEWGEIAETSFQSSNI